MTVCVTSEAALAEAIVCAQQDGPENARLSEANFGRYSDGSGWWWILRFTIEYSNKGAWDSDEFSRRCKLIIETWQAKVAEYEEYDKGQCPGGC